MWFKELELRNSAYSGRGIGIMTFVEMQRMMQVVIFRVELARMSGDDLTRHVAHSYTQAPVRPVGARRGSGSP